MKAFLALSVPCSSAKRFKSEPGFSPAPWNQSTSAPTPSTSHFQSPAYNRSDSVLSPYYQSNNSPSAAPSFPSSVGTPASAGPGFGSPTSQRQMAPKLSKSATMPMTPQQLTNPPSVNLPSVRTDMGEIGGQMQMQPGSIGYGAGNPSQQLQSSLFSGKSVEIS